MRGRTRGGFSAMLLMLPFLSAVPSCSVVFDPSYLDSGCGPEYKNCDQKCVLKNLPAFGCQSSSCLPCELKNAIAKCDDVEGCVVDRCLSGFGCDQCSSYLLLDEANCGTCKHECASDQVCAAGECLPVR